MSIRNMREATDIQVFWPARALRRADLTHMSVPDHMRFPFHASAQLMNAGSTLFQHELAELRRNNADVIIAGFDPFAPPVTHPMIAQLQQAMEQAAIDVRFGGSRPPTLNRDDINYNMRVRNIILPRETIGALGLPVWMTTEQRNGTVTYIGFNDHVEVTFERSRPSTFTISPEYLTNQMEDPA